MNVRTFQPGDENAQVALYNTAAQGLPRFKPATVFDVQRRVQASDFDAGQRFYADEGGKVVGYATFCANGRVSFPWCLPGHEAAADRLFEHVLAEMKRRGIQKAFAAYRADWPVAWQFFAKQGFAHARDMASFLIALVDMPTAPARASSPITPLDKADLPSVLELSPGTLRVRSVAELEACWFHNPYFNADCLFVLRGRDGRSVTAVGLFIKTASYADPKQLDANMPCFRLGAFGTETMQVKRVRGLFSFLAKADQNVQAIGLDLVGHAALRLEEKDPIEVLAAQVPSDAPHLLTFYQRNFQRQGAFPVWEKNLA